MSLAKLSTELVFWVAIYLRPEDVLTFGKTCKRFSNICEDTILWRQLAYQMCLTNAALIPHDLQKLSLKELKHMATSPSRVLRLLRAHRQPAKATFDNNKKDLYPKVSRNVLSPVRLEQVAMIPGGRYVVSLSCKTLHFWDLNAIPESAMILKEWTHSGDNAALLVYAPMKDQKGLRIVVTSSGPTAFITVYELTFNNTGEVIVTSVKTACEGDPFDEEFSRWGLFGDQLVYIYGSVVTVWNFEINTFVKLDVGALVVDECREIILHRNILWLLCADLIVGWTLPQPAFLDVHLSQIFEQVPPEFEVALQHPSKAFKHFMSNNDPGWASSDIWYASLGPPLAFFDLVWTSRGRDKLSTFPLETLYGANPATAPITSTSTMSIPALENQHFSQPYEDRTICDTRHCKDFYIKQLYSFKRLCFYLVVSSGPGTGTGCSQDFRVSLPFEFAYEDTAKTLEERDEFVQELQDLFFDPVAGRACMIGGIDKTEIHLWEYLATA